MIFIRFFLLILIVYLVVRTAARLILRVSGIRWFISPAGRRPSPPVRQDSPGAVDAEYEVIESHIRDDARGS
ncbi:MAG: hypothetical protein HGB02_07600 [Chlorobiaceae bacterium]|nr:hypothetical protein [Chlorobiaceae bacterium]